MVHEDHHGPKGASPKSGRKERKMKVREIISNTQYPREEKGTSNIERPTSNDELRKKEDTAVSWKKITIIEVIHEDHHGPKGASPKSGRKEKKMKVREIISHIEHGISNAEGKIPHRHSHARSPPLI
jgi:hypothetical protein